MSVDNYNHNMPFVILVQRKLSVEENDKVYYYCVNDCI